jgi:beta-glucosidase
MEAKIDGLLKKMTLEEKVSLWRGCSGSQVGGIKRLGIPKIKMTDGPQGVRGPVSTYFPCGIAMASSWDERLMFEVGAALADETRRGGADVLLGPGVNIMRTPLCGRNFEYFGEDPFLAGKIAAAYVRGIQSRNVSACVKHFVANNQEWSRTGGSSEVDERALREIYLGAFRIACMEGGAWAVMAAYNKVNGVFASANPHLLREIPREDWKWDGTVISDWGAAHDWRGCVTGGLDLVMPGPRKEFANKLLSAVQSGEISEDLVDEHVRRVLRFIFRTRGGGAVGIRDVEEARRIARSLAAGSVVLLKNDGILPLEVKRIKSLAVIGPNADKQHSMSGVLGSGGSGAVNPPYETTPLHGLRKFTNGEVQINFVPGYSFANGKEVIPLGCLKVAGRNGLAWSYFPNADFKANGAVVHGNGGIDLNAIRWKAGARARGTGGDFSVAWSGEIIPPESGKYTFYLESRGRVELLIDGKTVLKVPGSSKVLRGNAKLELEKGTPLPFELKYASHKGARPVLKLKWKRPDAKSDIESAVKAASNSDAAIVFAGLNHTYDREAIGWGIVPGSDRPDIELIGPQAELINAVAKANPNTIVVLIGGGPISVEKFQKNVKAILMAWYPGQDGGDVIAEILFGQINPSGKVCCTWGKKLDDWAVHRDGNYPGKANGPVEYAEGVFVGYRQFDRDKIQPRYPFGFGLSYTTFDVGKPQVSREDDAYVVRILMENTGKLAGSEVLQLYVEELQPKLPRPPKELKGFVKIHLDPGEAKTAEFALRKRDFSYYDPDAKAWRFNPGKYRLHLGTSSRDIRGTIDVDIDF